MEDSSIPDRILGKKKSLNAFCNKLQAVTHNTVTVPAKVGDSWQNKDILLQDSPSTIKNMLRWILIYHMITTITSAIQQSNHEAGVPSQMVVVQS